MTTRKPCLTCGGTKPPGSGRKSCDLCILANRRSSKERANERHRKPCARCGGPKEPGRNRRYCVSCAPQAAEEYRLRQLEGRKQRYANEERVKGYHREHSLRKRYGLDLDDYAEMLADQDGVCAVCKRPPPATRSLAVDHDHETGEVRGLLCQGCNAMLGIFERYRERVLGYLPDPTEIGAG